MMMGGKDLGWLVKRYNVYAVFGVPGGNDPWRDESWSAITESLKTFHNSIETEAAVRVTQLSSNEAKEIKYGRLSLDNRSNLKWTHKNDSDAYADKIIFHRLEVWAPSWNVCSEKNTSPDLFMSITNEKTVFKKVSVNPIYIIACNEKLYDEKRCIRWISDLKRITRISRTYYSRRKWGKRFMDGFVDSLQDYPHSSLFEIDDIHQSALSEESFIGKWTEISVAD